MDRKSRHSSNVRPGGKAREELEPSRVVFSFFLLPKLLLGMEGGRKGAAGHKRESSELMPTWYLRITELQREGFPHIPVDE